MKLVRFASSLAALATVFCAAGRSQTTTLVSVGPDGSLLDGAYYVPSISADARFVAFSSEATSLAPPGAREAYHVVVRDLVANETTFADVVSHGVLSGGSSFPSRTSISSDGRFVAFDSDADGLVPNDANGISDVFVHDRATGQTARVSVDSLGAQGNRASYLPSISGDGRFVAFVSFATNLVPGDTNECIDVFVHDRATRRTIRASVDSNGVQANFDSNWPAISTDGRCVAFESNAFNLVPDDTNSLPDVFVHDLTSGRTERVSINSQGAQSTNGYDTYVGSLSAAISSDGRFVGFLSDAAGLDHVGPWGLRGFFVHDRTTGATTRVSVNSDGFPAFGASIYYFAHGSISGDGRYFAFWSRDPWLSAGDTNFTYDVFVHDLRTRETTRQSVSSSGALANGMSVDPVLSADGRFIVFGSIATNLVDEPTNGEGQVFARGRLGHDVIQEFCAGDSTTATICPCFNFGSPRHGCASSQVADGGKLAGSGRPSTNTVVLTASSLPASSLTIFLQGSTNSVEGILFGDGVRCADGTLTRLYTRTAVQGSASAPDISELAIPDRAALLGDPIGLGESRYYQAYYRDPDLSFCTGSGFNVTNAVLVEW